MHRSLRTLLEPPNPLDRFGRLIQRADRANSRRDWAAAEAGYAAALRVDPLRDDLWVQYGHALKEQGRLADAAGAYRRATDIAPRDVDARLQAAHAFKALGCLEEARQAFRTLLALDPTAQHARDELKTLDDDQPVPSEQPPFIDAFDLPLRSRDGAAFPPGEDARGWPGLPRLPLGRRERLPQPIVFFHLHKTGGLTLDDVIGNHVAPTRVCPIKDDRLHVLSRSQLAGFDLFSGHCDVSLLRLLDRPVRTLGLFREPRARLISFYRFHRGHALTGKHRVNAFAQMANAMSAEEFFEDERIRRAPEVFNHYLTVFGLTYHQVRTSPPVVVGRVTADLLSRAIGRVRGLDAVGILERFDDSAALACATLGLPPPAAITPLNRTDRVTARMKREQVPRVTMTPRLAAAMADLVRFDDPIYRAAADEFERRFAGLAPPSPR